MVWLDNVPEVNDMCLCKSPDSSLCHLDSVLKLIFSQFDLKVILFLLYLLLNHRVLCILLLKVLLLRHQKSRIRCSVVLAHDWTTLNSGYLPSHEIIRSVIALFESNCVRYDIWWVDFCDKIIPWTLHFAFLRDKSISQIIYRVEIPFTHFLDYRS